MLSLLSLSAALVSTLKEKKKKMSLEIGQAFKPAASVPPADIVLG